MQITLLNRTFRTKADAIDHFKSYFQAKWKANEELTDEDKENLKLLLKNREDFEAGYVDKITNFKMITNKYNAFEIQYEYELNWFAFSISQCVIGKPKSKWYKFTSTLRESINDQILDYKKSNPMCVCALCKSTDKIQVDHIINFCSIVEKFMKNNKIEPTSELTNDQISSFVTYHRETARYRYLCGSCNIAEFNRSGRKASQTKEEYLQKNKEKAKERYHKLINKVKEMKQMLNEDSQVEKKPVIKRIYRLIDNEQPPLPSPSPYDEKIPEAEDEPIVEWKNGICEICKHEDEIHFGYGQCFVCINNCVRKE